MRPLLAAAALFLACVGATSRLETLFSVSLPYAESNPNGGTSTYVFGDGLYVIAGSTNSVIEAVNLTTRTNTWVSTNLSTYGYINTLAITASVILVDVGSNVVAISTQTGQQMWVMASDYALMYPPAAYVYGNTIYAQVILPSRFYALQAFDLATGTPGYFQYGNDLQIDGNTAFIAEYSLNGQMIVNPYLRAVDIPTNTTLWTVSAPDQAPGRLVQVMNSEYLAFSNFSGNDEIAVVLHRKNGSVAQAFQAFNGFESHGVAALHGNMLFALIGYEYPRYVLVDLTTGYIVWTRNEAEIGYGGVLSGDALVSISYSLVLTITPIGGSGSSISVPQVPSLPNPWVVDFGNGLVQVGNLQGYTMWDTATGTYLGRNEQMPNTALLAPLKWNGLSIMVSGNVVSALKVVS